MSPYRNILLLRLFRLFHCRHAAAMIEFTLFLPLLLTILYGTIELGRYVLIVQKVDKAAYTIADMVTRIPPDTSKGLGNSTGLNKMEMDEIFDTFEDLMDPYGNDNGLVMVASIYKDPAQITPVIQWQVAGGGKAFKTLTSEITGKTSTQMNPTIRGTPISLSPRMQTIWAQAGPMVDDENMIIVEVYYEYEPLLFPDFLNVSNTIGFNAFFMPRAGKLLDLPPNFT